MSVSPLDDTEPRPRVDAAVRVGRYLVDATLGAGAMGVVYEAYDPELDRKVALKLIPAGPGAAARADELRRQAQAMARIRHDHVITVYDVGSDGERLFVAMELIPGVTLASWWRARRRSVAELLEVFAAAADGLCAAHQAGVAHGDFKAENVLLGSDGRVCVSDFGLAPHAVAAADSASAPVDSAAAAGDSAAATVDDVRAFSIALGRALDGRRLPRRVRRRLARATTMPELAAALAPPRRRWPTLALAAAALAIVVAATALVWPRDRAADRVRLCRQAGPSLAQLWNDAARARLEPLVTGAQGKAAWQRVATALDRYARDWQALHDTACQSAARRDSESQSLLDLRLACLSRQRQELGSLVTMLVSQPESARRATQATAALTPVEACADETALRRPLPAPVPAATLQPLGELVTRARVEVNLERCKQGLADATEAQRRAHALGALVMESEALSMVGLAEECLGQLDAAHISYGETAILAARAQNDRATVKAYLRLANHAADHAAFADAERWLEEARETVAKRGGDTELRAQLEFHQCYIPLMHDRLAVAEPHCKRARALFATLPARSELEVDAVNALGILLRDQARFAEAAEVYRDARRLAAELTGDSQAAEQRYRCLLMDDEVEQDHLETALALYKGCIGADSGTYPNVLSYELSSYASILVDAGRARESLPYARRALATAEKIDGPHEAELGSAYAALGSAYLALGKPQLAVGPLEQAWRLIPVEGNADDRALVGVDFARALWLATPRHARAVEVARQSRDRLRDHPLGAMRARYLRNVEAWLRAREAS